MISDTFLASLILESPCREIEFLDNHKNILSTLKLTSVNRKSVIARNNNSTYFMASDHRV